MKKFLVAIAWVTIGLFVSLGFSAVAQNQPVVVPAPNSTTSANQNRMADVDRQFMMTAREARGI